VSAAAQATGAPPKARRSVHSDRGARIGRVIVLVLVLGWLFLPLIAALEFSTRGPGGERTLQYWAAILSSEDLIGVVGLSLLISLATVLGMLVLLATTMAWSYLRVPKARRLIEFVCLLPLAIPAVVLVVGVAPIYREIRVNLSSSPLMLALIYLVLVLPYAYRSIDGGLRSVDVATLADAARSLGAGWPRVMFQIIFPNNRTSLLSAAVLSVALVMGEYTISSLLSYRTFQVVLYALGKRDGSIAVAVSLAALVFVFLVLFAINYFGTARRRTQAVEEE
jgi:putative spermidine/putrescine transport system permease protein